MSEFRNPYHGDPNWSHEPTRPQETELDRAATKLLSAYDTFGHEVDSRVCLDQQAQIISDLEAGHPVLLRGLKTIGKTSMAETIRHRLFDTTGVSISAPLSFLAKPRTDNEDFRVRLGLRNVAECVNAYENPTSRDEVVQAIIQSGKSPLVFLNDWAAERGLILPVVIDETTYIYYKQNLPKEWAAALNEVGRLPQLRVMAILHVLQGVREVRDQIPDYKEYYIRPLSLEETGQIVSPPAAVYGISYTDGAIRTLWELSGGRPTEAKELLKVLLTSGTPFSKRQRIYAEDDFTPFVERAEELLIPRGLEVCRVGFRYDQIWGGVVNPEEKRLLVQLAHQGPTALDTEYSDEALWLERMALVRKLEDGSIAVNGELFRQWLLGYRPGKSFD